MDTCKLIWVCNQTLHQARNTNNYFLSWAQTCWTNVWIVNFILHFLIRSYIVWFNFFYFRDVAEAETESISHCPPTSRLRSSGYAATWMLMRSLLHGCTPPGTHRGPEGGQPHHRHDRRPIPPCPWPDKRFLSRWQWRRRGPVSVILTALEKFISECLVISWTSASV